MYYCVGRCGSEILVEYGRNGECVATCGYCRCMQGDECFEPTELCNGCSMCEREDRYA
jgi:hypothetical protein